MSKQILLRVNKDMYGKIETISKKNGFDDIQDFIRDNLEKEIKKGEVNKMSFFNFLKIKFFNK